MNKRIRELYDQAIVIEDGGDYVCGELDPVKFAELIVEECCKVIEDHYEPVYDGKLLKRHFGVDE